METNQELQNEIHNTRASLATTQAQIAQMQLDRSRFSDPGKFKTLTALADRLKKRLEQLGKAQRTPAGVR